MDTTRGRASATACDFCRSKKYKCSKERPSCRICANQNRPCHYSGQIVRSPLTRAYLTETENRLHQLQKLFSELLPDVNLDEALASRADDSRPGSTSRDGRSSLSPTPVKEEPESESLPSQATGFDWNEDDTEVSDLTDGMASLSVDPSGKGYLGSTSGVVFLRSLLTRQGSFDAHSQSPHERPLHFDKMTKLPEGSEFQELARMFVNTYFSHYHTAYPFIHEATFRAQWSQLVPRPPAPIWNMLFYSVLALGGWCLDDQTEADMLCYKEALASFNQQSAIFETGSLPLVQALLLLSNYTQKCNKPNTGWNYLGLAVRMALSLGLHRELPEWEISLLEREMRRRVWWGLFIFESGASMTFGRAILLPPPKTVDAKPVLNIFDEVLTPTTTGIPEEASRPTLYTGLILQSQFHLLANDISNRLLSQPPLTAGEALRLNGSLRMFKERLPKSFDPNTEPVSSSDWYRFAKARLYWRLLNFQIILTRPFLPRPGDKQSGPVEFDEAECTRVCISSAHLTVLSVHTYVIETPLTRLSRWYALFFLFHATLVLVASSSVGSFYVDTASRQDDIGTVIFLLTNYFRGYPLATRCLEVLERLLPNAAEGTRVEPAPAASSLADEDLVIGDPFILAGDPFFGWPQFAGDEFSNAQF